MATPTKRTKADPDERTTLNVRGIKVFVARAIRAAAAGRGQTIAEYLETLMPEITRDLRTAAR